MPIDMSVQNSPGWWLAMLHQRLEQRRYGFGWSAGRRHRRYYRPGLDLLDDYLRGDPPLPDVASGWGDLYAGLLREARMNYADLVVSSKTDRMIPLGWTTAVDSDETGDQVAERISVANELPLRLSDAFRKAIAFGSSYLMVGGPRPELGGMPSISAEDPRETITADDPVTGRAMAALKMFCDEWTGDQLAYVYTPGTVWVARRGSGIGYSTGGGWEWDQSLSRDYPPGFADLVPVVHLQNTDGRGEFEPHLSVLDRINSEIFRRVTVAMWQAHRQRGIKGLPKTDDDQPPNETGSNVVDYSDAFVADPMSIWLLPADADIWESGTVDITGIRASVKDDATALCAVTGTPLYSLVPDAANGSAEGAALQRESNGFRVKGLQQRFGPRISLAMSMGFRYLGEADRADILSIRTLWAPIERYSITEKAAASQQLKGILPDDWILRDVMQYSTSELEDIQAARARDLQRQAEAAIVLQPPAAKPPPPTAPAPAPTVNA